jgi:hypothetical protein
MSREIGEAPLQRAWRRELAGEDLDAADGDSGAGGQRRINKSAT